MSRMLAWQELERQVEELKLQDPTPTALAYYQEDKLYVFNSIHNSDVDFEVLDRSRPRIETLYDVFKAIRDDEMEHVKTMSAMQLEDIYQEKYFGANNRF